MKLVQELTLVVMAVLAGSPSLAQDATKDEGAKLLQELTATRVRIDVEGDLVAVQEELTKFEERLRALGAAAPPAARRKLLEAQVAVYLKRNKVAEASALLDGAGIDPALEALRAEVRAAAGQGATASDSLRNIVDSCIERNDLNRLRSLGSAAVDYVGQIALASAGDFPEVDILPVLVEMDERFAVHFLVEHFDAGGPIWKRRILAALRADDSLHDRGTWTNDQPYVLLEPELLVLYERLLREPATAKSALGHLVTVEDRDALSPELVRTIVAGLKTQGPEFAAAAMAFFDGKSVSRTAQPILEAALDVPDERIRRLAAQKLVSYERSEALLARYADPDPILRRCVAEALGYHEGFLQEGGNNADDRAWNPTMSEHDLPRLRALLRDADPTVRHPATRALWGLETPLEPVEYERLAHDESEDVRLELLKLTRLPEGMRPGLLALLASDSSTRILRTLDELLAYAANWNTGANATTSALARDPSPYLPALEMRWSARLLPLDENKRAVLRNALLESDLGLQTLVTWSFATGDAEALRKLVGQTTPDSFLALSDEMLARMLASTPRAWGGDMDELWQAVRDAQPRRAAAMRLLLADTTASRTVRLAAAVLATDGAAGYGEALLGLLRAPIWTGAPLDGTEVEALASTGKRMATADGGSLCLAVLRDAAIPVHVARAFLSEYPTGVAQSAEITREVLARWLEPGMPYSEAVERAIEHLGSRPDLAGGSVLDTALVHPLYSEQALLSMAALRNPAYLPKIARGLEAEWAPIHQRDSIQVRAAEALASFNDPAAAEYLLLGLKSPVIEARTACKEGLERLEEYERHARAWKDRNLAAPTKESALADLVTMLADKDPVLRAQAALGLATLGAVETLPQLIRLLKDSDANVRAAAQKALDRLNAAPAPGEGG